MNAKFSAISERSAEFFSGILHRGAFAKRLLFKKLQLHKLRKSCPIPIDRLRRVNALVMLWGRPNTFPSNDLLRHEPNFGRLPALLNDAGIQVGYVAYPLTFLSPFKTIAANALHARDPVAVIEDFVPWWAVFTVPFAGLSLPLKLLRLSVLGVDASETLRLEARRGLCVSASPDARLLRYVASGLAKLNIHPDFVVHQYEGQPWEKAFGRSMRNSLPQSSIVAVQHAPFSHNHLSWIPSAQEIADNSIPDKFMMSGVGYAEILEKAGIPKSRLSVLGAVRYEQIGAGPLGGTVALCCTGIQLDEAIELATKAAIATAQTKYRLVINFHPVTDRAFREALQRGVNEGAGPMLSHVEFSAAPMRKLLDGVSVVLYSSSAAAFDAVQAGRTAVYVARDLDIDYDKLPEEISLRSRSVEDLTEILLNRIPCEVQKTADMNKWLAPTLEVNELRSVLMPLMAAGLNVKANKIEAGAPQ